jgi:probable HAF family extracellular repeat protein
MVTYVGNNTIAYDVNNKGDAVGMVDQKAFIYRQGKLIEIGTVRPEDRQSAAYGVNDRSDVVGYSAQESINDGQAFLYRERTGVVGLGRLKDTDAYSVAVSVNDCGHVVGFSGSNVNFYAVTGLSAFIFANGRMTDLNAVALNASGVKMTAASGINDRGQIVGRGLNDGRLHAFVLTPKHDRQRCGESDDEE